MPNCATDRIRAESEAKAWVMDGPHVLGWVRAGHKSQARSRRQRPQDRSGRATGHIPCHELVKGHRTVGKQVRGHRADQGGSQVTGQWKSTGHRWVSVSHRSHGGTAVGHRPHYDQGRISGHRRVRGQFTGHRPGRGRITGPRQIQGWVIGLGLLSIGSQITGHILGQGRATDHKPGRGRVMSSGVPAETVARIAPHPRNGSRRDGSDISLAADDTG